MNRRNFLKSLLVFPLALLKKEEVVSIPSFSEEPFPDIELGTTWCASSLSEEPIDISAIEACDAPIWYSPDGGATWRKFE